MISVVLRYKMGGGAPFVTFLALSHKNLIKHPEWAWQSGKNINIFTLYFSSLAKEPAWAWTKMDKKWGCSPNR